MRSFGSTRAIACVVLLSLAALCSAGASASAAGPEAVTTRSAGFRAQTDSCWSAPISSLCVGDLSTRALPAGDANGFSLLSFPDATPVAGAPASPVVGFWDFEDVLAQDSSPHNNAFNDPIPAVGPGFLRGSSAHFTGLSAHSLPHIDAYAASPAATVSFWVYPTGEVHDGFRSLLHKGASPNAATGHVDAFSLRMWSDTYQLRLTVGGRDTLDSRAALPLRRWSHVALTLSPTAAELFLNGQRDSTLVFAAGSPATTALQRNTDSLYVGSAPPRTVSGLPCFLDKLEWRAGVAPAAEIKAAAGQALLGVPGGVDFVWPGCEDCTRADADKACAQAAPVTAAVAAASAAAAAAAAANAAAATVAATAAAATAAAASVSNASGAGAGAGAVAAGANGSAMATAGAAPRHPPSHVCTARELATSALLVARVMGWVPMAHVPRAAVFDHENSLGVPAAARGFGLCCLDE